MARSLNRVQLIGNLTRDPELRYTPSGAAVCSFSIATNRSWTTDTGEKRDEADFHRIIAWNKLAEICSQFLVKGRKVYVEGRLQTRNWTGQDGTQKSTTEIIINEMILLDSKKQGEEGAVNKTSEVLDQPKAEQKEEAIRKPEKSKNKKAEKEDEPNSSLESQEVSPDDIPF